MRSEPRRRDAFADHDLKELSNAIFDA